MSRKILQSVLFENYFSCDIDNNKSHQKDFFLKNYGNSDFMVSRDLLIVEVYQKKSTIGIRFFYSEKQRRLGKKFFKEKKVSRFFSFSKKNNNFYWGFETGTKKKIQTRKVRCNSFYMKPFFDFSNDLKNWSSKIVFFDSKGNLDQIELIKSRCVIENVINDFFDKLFEGDHKSYEEIKCRDTQLFKFYLSQNGISIPDTVRNFVKQKFSKKELLKSGNLINSFMKKFDLKGRKVRKLLNTGLFYNLEYIILLYRTLGVDYFNMIEEDKFKLDNHPCSYTIEPDPFYRGIWQDFDFNKSDRKKFIELVNDGVNMWDIIEHMNLIKVLNERGISFKLESRDNKRFQLEHQIVSEIYSELNDYTVYRQYDRDFLKFIKDKFIFEGEEYKIKVLENTEEYIDESKIQHNCVRTYQTRCSFIISIRSNTGERLTLEYELKNNKLDRIQSRSKYNLDLNDKEKKLCKKIDKKLNDYLKSNKMVLPKIILKSVYEEIKIESQLNKVTKNLEWKEIIPKFDNNVWGVQANLDLPF